MRDLFLFFLLAVSGCTASSSPSVDVVTTAASGMLEGRWVCEEVGMGESLALFSVGMPTGALSMHYDGLGPAGCHKEADITVVSAVDRHHFTFRVHHVVPPATVERDYLMDVTITSEGPPLVEEWVLQPIEGRSFTAVCTACGAGCAAPSVPASEKVCEPTFGPVAADGGTP